MLQEVIPKMLFYILKLSHHACPSVWVGKIKCVLHHYYVGPSRSAKFSESEEPDSLRKGPQSHFFTHS